MREIRIVTWAISLLLVISISCVPLADASAYGSHSLSPSRPSRSVVPRDVLQQSPGIEWRKEIRSPNNPHGGGAEFYFLPHVEPGSSDEVPQVPGNWC